MRLRSFTLCILSTQFIVLSACGGAKESARDEGALALSGNSAQGGAWIEIAPAISRPSRLGLAAQDMLEEDGFSLNGSSVPCSALPTPQERARCILGSSTGGSRTGSSTQGGRGSDSDDGSRGSAGTSTGGGANVPAGARGTLLKQRNAQSASLADSQLCFIPAGKYILRENPESVSGGGLVAFRVKLASPLAGCPFSEGFVDSTHVSGVSDRWVRPVATAYGITSNYGQWRSCGSCSNPHQGIDYGAPIGTRVGAARGGRVLFAGWDDSTGYIAAIEHQVGGRMIVSRHMHNSRLLVATGSRVAAGSQVASSGNTGLSTGPHCHFDMKSSSGTWGRADVNPHHHSNVFR